MMGVFVLLFLLCSKLSEPVARYALHMRNTGSLKLMLK